MGKILQNFNLFPYTQLWRIGKKSQHNNFCGVLVSIFIILGMGGLFIAKFINVIQKDSLTVTSTVDINPSPPSTSITTHQHNNNSHPFMIAFRITANKNTSIQPQIKTYKYNQKVDGSSSETLITMQNCTTMHFSKLSGRGPEFDIWNGSNSYCLPLNQTYNIEGSRTLKTNYESINFLFTCDDLCMAESGGFNIHFNSLSSVINTKKSAHPNQYFLEEFNLPIKKRFSQEYSLQITQNLINTDESLFPLWKSIHTTLSTQVQNFKQVQQIANFTTSQTQLFLQRSKKTIVYDRQHVNVLDILAYVGGIFKAIIGFLILSAVFAQFAFELHFAKLYFESEYMKKITSKQLLYQLYYKIRKILGFIPEDQDQDWHDAEERDKLQKCANQLMDVIYLHRRIDFLQRAISVVLDEHQLQALHLVRNRTRIQAEESFEDYQIRKRLEKYYNRIKWENRNEYKQIVLQPVQVQTSYNLQNQHYSKQQIQASIQQFQIKLQAKIKFRQAIKIYLKKQFNQSDQSNFFDNYSQNDENFENQDKESKAKEDQFISQLGENLIKLRKQALSWNQSHDKDKYRQSKVIYSKLDREIQQILKSMTEQKRPDSRSMHRQNQFAEIQREIILFPETNI